MLGKNQREILKKCNYGNVPFFMENSGRISFGPYGGYLEELLGLQAEALFF